MLCAHDKICCANVYIYIYEQEHQMSLIIMSVFVQHISSNKSMGLSVQEDPNQCNLTPWHLYLVEPLLPVGALLLLTEDLDLEWRKGQGCLGHQQKYLQIKEVFQCKHYWHLYASIKHNNVSHVHGFINILPVLLKKSVCTCTCTLYLELKLRMTFYYIILLATALPSFLGTQSSPIVNFFKCTIK